MSREASRTHLPPPTELAWVICLGPHTTDTVACTVAPTKFVSCHASPVSSEYKVKESLPSKLSSSKLSPLRLTALFFGFRGPPPPGPSTREMRVILATSSAAEAWSMIRMPSSSSPPPSSPRLASAAATSVLHAKTTAARNKGRARVSLEIVRAAAQIGGVHEYLST